MTPLKTDRLLPMCFFSLVVILLSIAIPTARANPELVNAIKNNDLEKIQKLIEDGVDINQEIDDKDYFGRIRNALYLASIYGRSEVVRLLIHNGMNLELTMDSALRGAAGFGQLKIVRMLIEEYNANYLEGRRGESCPLTYAATGGHLNVVEYLLNLKPETVNYGKDFTPLQAAFDHPYNGKNRSVVELLFRRGANPNLNGAYLLRSAISQDSIHNLALLVNHPEFDRDLINMPGHHGQTPSPLQLAREIGNQEIIALLIQHEATPVEQTVTISDDPGLTTKEQEDTSLSINAETNSTMEMAASETQPPLAISLNESENTTATLEALKALEALPSIIVISDGLDGCLPHPVSY